MWKCPLCHSEFIGQKTPEFSHLKMWKCEQGHSFDKAKQGYVNLLPVQQKRSLQPGDDKQMVLARHEFLSQDYYLNIVEYITKVLSEKNLKPSTIYDAGCGTGYYIDKLAKHFKDANAKAHDISKDAVVCAARSYKTSLCVASSINIPVTDSSQDLLLQVFSPACEPEYQRVMNHDGLLITVNPGPQHLSQLKGILYENSKEHDTSHEVFQHFEMLSEQRLTRDITLKQALCAENLLKMTPYFWKASAEQRTQVADELRQVTTDFIVRIYQVKRDIATDIKAAQ